MARTALSPGRLYSLLNGEFIIHRPAACLTCRMPLPYRVDRPDEVSANWRIGTPPPCPHGCDVLIAEIVARHWPLHDLLDPFSEASAKPTRERGDAQA